MKNNEKTERYSEFECGVEPLKVLVVGASGGTGRVVVEKLLNDGHRVTAFSRSANTLTSNVNRLAVVKGDVTDLSDIGNAVNGQNVVIVTLGINENPLRVRFLGSACTPQNVRSAGTRNVINVMKEHGVNRLIVQSSYGIGETRGLLPFFDQLFFSLILKPQIEDTEVQERLVRNSGLDWVIARPVHLSDENSDVFPFISEKGQTRKMKVARRSVAKFLALATQQTKFVGKSVVISG